MKSHIEREKSIGYLVHEVARLLRRRFEDEARVHGITLPQWRTLAEIANKDCISQVNLANAVDTDPMTMSGILDRLEKRGLIERYSDPKDSRAKLARLTEGGEELMTTARNVGLAMYERALDGVSQRERDRMVAGLRRIRDNLNNMSAEQKEAV